MSRKVEEFKPITEGVVKMYTCGPTVYNYPHIGNYRTYVFEDLLRRYLEYKGYKVIHVMNITDVDDKTIRDSQKEGIPLKLFTSRYETAFYEDLYTLNIKFAHYYPHATETIPEMVALIKKLIEKGYAYKGEDGSYYYSVKKFKDYGKLAHIDVSQLKPGARVSHDEYEKQELADFALWKAWDEKDGPVYWDTELGRGRPGWHIECSAMSMKYLGNHFDIHCGGVDNIFPHHENEIAQSEAATGEKFVNYWLHSEHLIVEGKKMSKSLGNFYTLRDLLNKGYNPRAIRYLLLSTHYREQLNFTFDALKAATETIENIDIFIQRLLIKKEGADPGEIGITDIIEKARKGFEEGLDNDLQISQALPHIFKFMNVINSKMREMKKNDYDKALEFMKRINEVLGVIKFELPQIPDEVKELMEKRRLARQNKDWETSDKLREEIRKRGFEVHDEKDNSYVIKRLL